MIPLIVIAGPTGVGKSKVALSLAKRLGGEIISADSLQVYRYFDIGTDKPSANALETVRHHLINIIDPDEEFSAGNFNELAYAAAKDIHKRGKIIIVCGGTGLYIKALLENFACGIPKDSSVVNQLKLEFPEHNCSRIYKRLQSVDADSAENIQPQDRYRIERALEVFYSSGKRLSEHHRNMSKEKRFEYRHLILHIERGRLYQRIEERVNSMIESGLLEETKRIIGMGYMDSLKPFQAIGYSQMVSYIRGEIGFDLAIKQIKQETRRFAKRQLTWLRGVKEGEWTKVDPDISSEKIVEEITELLNLSGC